MPANTAQIDWSGIRAAAIALNSVRDAAMRVSSDLPPDEQKRFVERVNKRAYRERWLGRSRAIAKPNVAGARQLSKNVQTGSEMLSRIGEETKALLAKAGHKASKHLAKLQGAKITGQSSDFKNIVGANAQLHGWDTRFQGTQFSLNVLNLGDGNVQIGAVRDDQSEQQADARDV